jgi:NADH:ubiquinone oxidoreductase subunit H
MSVVVSFIAFLLFIVPILLTVAFFTLAERKVMGTIQRRKGPNVTGFGLLQPIADGIKLIIKETTIPSQSNAFLFLVAPYITIVLSLFN